MKVAIVSKADSFGGGASKVAVDLRAALVNRGIDATHHVGWAGKERLRDTYPAHVKPLFGKWPARIAVKCGLVAQWELGIPEAIPVEWMSVVSSGVLDADVIHVHDITEVLSPLTLLWISRRKPVVWTLHDMSPFTAGCIYPFEREPLGCHLWMSQNRGCTSDCPIRATKWYPFGGRFNGIPLLWKEKAALARYGRMALTTPSTWLADQVAASRLYHDRRPQVMYNGIDLNGMFLRRPKAECKSALGLPSDRITIALMAGDLSDLNKGFSWAIDTLNAMPAEIRTRLQLVCIGTRGAVAEDALAGFETYWAGYVQDQRMLSILLNAADLLLYPSMADNQPLAVIEALASATPVFAFDTGGIAESIGDAGVAVRRKDVAALAAEIVRAATEGRLAALSDAARLRAESHFSRDRMAADCIALYEQMLLAPDRGHP
jgi:glycosyltransferase involved in cell wall biosynthesis